jgi:hypothetical protein
LKNLVVLVGIPDLILSEEDFNNYTSLFLFSQEGSQFSPNFYTKPSPLEYGKPIEAIEVSANL